MDFNIHQRNFCEMFIIHKGECIPDESDASLLRVSKPTCWKISSKSDCVLGVSWFSVRGVDCKDTGSTCVSVE